MSDLHKPSPAPSGPGPAAPVRPDGGGANGAPSAEAALVERSLRLNIAAGVFGMLWICCPLGAPLPLLMQAVHASSTQLGLLSAAWQAATLAQIPAALFAERQSRRKPMWAVVSILHRILWASPAVVPLIWPEERERWPVVLIVCLALSNFLSNLGTASWFSWMADLVPPESAGRFWAVRQRAFSIALIAATACYGWVLDRYNSGTSVLGFQWVFAACAFFGVLDIVVHCFVHEPPQASMEEGKPVLEKLSAPFQTPGFLRLTLLMAVWTAAQSLVGYTMAMPGFFSMVHLRENFGATYSQASLMFMAAALGGAFFCGVLGRWMDRAGALAVFTRMVVWTPVSMMAWWLAKPGVVEVGGNEWSSAVVWMCVAALLQGALCMGALLCQFRLTQMYTPSSGRTMAMALHWSIVGTIGALGGMGGGWLKEVLERAGTLPGGRYPFDVLVLLHVVLAWACVLPLSFKLAAPHAGASGAGREEVL